MTFQPGEPFDDNQPSLENEFHAFLDKEALFSMEANEAGSQIIAVEDIFMKKLVDSGFPIAAQLMDAHATIHASNSEDKIGLAATYDFLINRLDQLASDAESGSPSAWASKIGYGIVYKMSNLASTVELLAVAKCYQDELLNQAQYAEDNGDPESAESFKLMAYDARKEAEAQLLTDEQLAVEDSSEILLAVSSEFEGESLLPISDESRSYMMMYRLAKERSHEEADERKAYSQMAREILESHLKAGQMQHPEFEEFAFSLCRAASKSALAARHTIGFEPEKIDAYHELIQINVDQALRIAPELGIEPEAIQALFEAITSALE